MLGKKRCKILVIGIVIGVIVAVAIAAGVFFALHRRYYEDWKSRVEQDGHENDEFVQTDGVKHIIYVTRDQNNNFYKLSAVLDYDRKLAAFMDLTKNRCYIDKLNEEYEGGCERWRDYMHDARKPMFRPMLVEQPALKPAVVEYFGGPDIAAVCGSAPTYLVTELPRPDQDDSGQHDDDDQPTAPEHDDDDQPTAPEHDDDDQPTAPEHDDDDQPTAPEHDDDDQPTAPEHDDDDQPTPPPMDPNADIVYL